MDCLANLPLLNLHVWLEKSKTQNPRKASWLSTVCPAIRRHIAAREASMASKSTGGPTFSLRSLAVSSPSTSDAGKPCEP